MRQVDGALLAVGLMLATGACSANVSSSQDEAEQGVSVAVTPSSADLATSGSASFLAAVTGSTQTAVTWSITESGGGTVTSAGYYTAPAQAGTYHLVATSVADPTRSAQATIAVSADGGSQDTVAVVIDSSQARSAISPFVYGFNGTSASDSPTGTTWLRLGGNRWTAYNWETNWSNAGSDYWYDSDTYMGDTSDGVAHAVMPAMTYAKAKGIGLAATIPAQGYAAADKAGAVDYTASGYTPTGSGRFLVNQAAKGSAFSTSPSTSDSRVYQDEFANYLSTQWTGQSSALHLEIDNEPDLWSQTHPEVQGTTTPTYSEYWTKALASATAIKAAVPSAVVMGGVISGWYGYTTFNGSHVAGDSTWEFAEKGDFTEWLLGQMSAASTAAGKRLFDVLDLHYYTEATGGGTRVTAMGGTEDDTTPAIVAARVQAPRSLGSDGYVETSWITNTSTGSTGTEGAAIALIPRMLSKIASKYPGTKLAITEWNMGGGNHISGAVAVADSLGLFGREGLYAASYWPLTSYSAEVGASAAWRAYRSYDGAGSNFGAYAMPASTSDLSHLAVYASTDTASGTPAKVVLVLIHRPTLSGSSLDTRSRTITISAPTNLGTARAWQLTGSSGTPAWTQLTAPSVSGGALSLTLPAMSVTTVELTP